VEYRLIQINQWINSSEKNRGSVYLGQSLCLFRTETLFGINTGSVESEIISVWINSFSGWKGWSYLPLSAYTRDGV